MPLSHGSNEPSPAQPIQRLGRFPGSFAAAMAETFAFNADIQQLMSLTLNCLNSSSLRGQRVSKLRLHFAMYALHYRGQDEV